MAIRAIGLDRVTYRAAGNLSQEDHLDGLPLGTRGGMIVRHTFPLNADYDLQIGPGRSGGIGAVVTARAQDIDVTIDGQPVDLQGKTQVRLPVEAGPHTIAVALVKRSHVDGADGVYDAPTRAPGISQITIAGPFNARGPGDTPSRRRLYRLHAEGRGGGDGMRREDPQHAGDPRVSTAGAAVRSGDGDVARVLPDRA